MSVINDNKYLNINNTIEKITNSLKSIEPEKIILFGSYAKQKQTRDSDLDILVVTDSNFCSEKLC